MSLRLIYLVLCRVAGWPALLARTGTAKDIEILYALWWLIALRGLHRGEAAGLRWCDLDLDAGTVTIEQQCIAYGRTVQVGPPRSLASRRTIALDTTTVRLLARPPPPAAGRGGTAAGRLGVRR